MEFSVVVKDKVRLIRFERPHRKNAMTFSMYTGIAKAVEEANTDENTHFVVITGTGDYFSSGNDLSNYTNASGTMTVEQGCQIIREYVAAFINCRKPIIALVNGPAIGIGVFGVTILGLCDIVFATDRATFKCPFVSLGLAPEGCSSYLFPRIMGHAKAAQMLFFNAEMSSQEAFQAGLVTKVFPCEKFHSEVWKEIKLWLELPINSIVHSKDLMRSRELSILHQVNNAEWDVLLERIQSEDGMEAVIKYFEAKSTKSKL